MITLVEVISPNLNTHGNDEENHYLNYIEVFVKQHISVSVQISNAANVLRIVSDRYSFEEIDCI